MHRIRMLLASAVLLAGIATIAHGAETPPPATDFLSELKASLARGKESRRGIVFHVQGQEVAGVVKQVLSDAVVVSNQEHAHIVIRFDRIDAIAMD